MLTANIRQFYKPIQPTIKQSIGAISYIELLPAENLTQVIYCYWELKTTEALTTPFVYRVVADGCIDIFFELSKPQENFVMGFCKKFTEFNLGNTFHYIGVRFLPTMFPQLFRVSASTLSNRFESLSKVIPETADFIAEHFHKQLSITAIKQLLDVYFTGVCNKAIFNNDGRLYKALETILRKSGAIDIEQDLDIGISQRQLRRLFEFYVGDTAKTFAKVIRFQQVLHANPSVESMRKTKLFFDVGYYDQAHFIKEFKQLYGVTPGKAFGG